MAVYTEVSHEQAQALLNMLELGELLSMRGIEGGIENTNYFVDTLLNGQKNHWVLTIFERLTHEQLPFYLHLMSHLADKGLPVPSPQKKGSHAPFAFGEDELLHTLRGKPCAVVNRLNGKSELSPQVIHCEQVGKMLAKTHLAAKDYPKSQENLRGINWWIKTVPIVLPNLNPAQAKLIKSELENQIKIQNSKEYSLLPRGAVHADLFRDNVMFDVDNDSNPVLSGFFDYYFAGVDTWLFDLSVALNDWTINHKDGSPNIEKQDAFLKAYQSVRALTNEEKKLLPQMLRAGALRFWLSRLWDWFLPRQASMLKPHDPSHFERVLIQRIYQKDIF